MRSSTNGDLFWIFLHILLNNLHALVCCSGSYGLEPYLEVKTVRILYLKVAGVMGTIVKLKMQSLCLFINVKNFRFITACKAHRSSHV